MKCYVCSKIGYYVRYCASLIETKQILITLQTVESSENVVHTFVVS